MRLRPPQRPSIFLPTSRPLVAERGKGGVSVIPRRPQANGLPVLKNRGGAFDPFAYSYLIGQSLRLRASNSAFLSRTPGTPTDDKAFTLSFWVKRGNVANGSYSLISSGASAVVPYAVFQINTSFPFQLDFFQGTPGTRARLITNRMFRDPTAWIHVVYHYNSAHASATSRQRMWLNGIEETSFASRTDPAQNDASILNAARIHEIGRQSATATQYWDGYIAEMFLIDGQALTPSSFGEFHPFTNQWVPKPYAGAYGANGFYLPFNDATSAANLCLDRSGNGNNWTPTGISVANDHTRDAVLDSPTNNFCTINPVHHSSTVPTISNGNLRVVYTADSSGNNATTTLPIGPRMRVYYEVSCIVGATFRTIDCGPVAYRGETGVISATGGSTGGTGTFSTWSGGDRIAFAADYDARTVAVYRNGTLVTTVTGVDNTIDWFPYGGQANTAGAELIFNFGQQPFVNTPPAGFGGLSVSAMRNPSIPRGDDAFQAFLYNGTGAVQTITGLRFQPDLVWVKNRSGTARDHGIHDSVRGPNRVLSSSRSDGEYDAASPTSNNAVTSFNADGFTLGQDALTAFSNQSGSTYGGLGWRRGAAYGFDIVTYTGNGANRTIAHGLNAVPHMMIGKRRDATASWTVYHRSMAASPEQGYLLLNTTNAYTALSTIWNNTAPTSSVFSLGTDTNLNTNLATGVMYLWTSIPGFSLFGSFTGNGSSDGPFVWCGFRPRFVMIKPASAAESWYMVDAARNTFNPTDSRLVAESSGTEVASGMPVDFLANGFKLRTANGNPSGGTVIFAAFAESPFKFANAR